MAGLRKSRLLRERDKKNTSLTLVETVVVVTIFALIAVSAGSAIFTAQRTQRRLQAKMDLISDGQWALDRMVNELRHSQAGALFIYNPPTLGYNVAIGFETNLAPGERVWFWQGVDGIQSGNVVCNQTNVLYRGVDYSPFEALEADSLNEACGNNQELTPRLNSNITGDIFQVDANNIITITISTQDQQSNQAYTLKTKVRPRN